MIRGPVHPGGEYAPLLNAPLDTPERQARGNSNTRLWKRVSNSPLFPQSGKSVLLLGISAIGAVSSFHYLRVGTTRIQDHHSDKALLLSQLAMPPATTLAFLSLYHTENQRVIAERRKKSAGFELTGASRQHNAHAPADQPSNAENNV